MVIPCAGCNGPALGKLALRFYCVGHQNVAGWIISAVPSCGPCAKRVRPEEVATREEVEAAAVVTRRTHDAEPGNFKVCLKPFAREAGTDATVEPVEPPKPSLKEELEALWQEPMGGV